MKSILRYFIAVLSALYILSGCNTPNHLIKSIQRKENKLALKGVTVPKDTIYSTDTLITILTSNDTTYITKEITHTLKPEVVYKTRWETRYETKYKYKTVKVENKAMIDSLRQELKNTKENTKVKRIENRKSKWWLWLLIGFGLGILSRFLLSFAKI